MIGRVASVGAIAAGIALIAVTFALSLFPRAYAGERVADNFRPVMSPMGVAQQQAALKLVGGYVASFETQASPLFARQLHMNGAQYARFLAAEYPPIAYGVKEVPAAAASLVGPVVAQAPKIQPKYERVTHIPGLGLPIAAAAWILVLTGVALVAVGAVGVVRPRPPVAVSLLVLALGMVVVPFALNLPAKTRDSGPVLKLGRVAVSQYTATAAHRTALAVDDMVTTTRLELLPDLARRLHTTRAALDATIARAAPGMATGLHEWPAIAPAAYNLTGVQQATVADFKKVDGIGYSGLEWVAIGPGIALVLLAGAAVMSAAGERRRLGSPTGARWRRATLEPSTPGSAPTSS